jgi:hypothetical protein
MNKFSEPAGEIDIKNIQTSDPKKVEDEAKEPVKEQAKQPDLVHSQKDRKSHTENSIIPIDDPSKLKRSATKQNTGKLSEKDRPKTILHKQLNENSDKRLLDESLGESQYELQRKNSEMKNGKDIAIPGTQPPSPTKEDRKNSEIKNGKNIAVSGIQPPSPTKEDRKNSEIKNGKNIAVSGTQPPSPNKEDRNSEIKNCKNIGIPGTQLPSPTKEDRKNFEMKKGKEIGIPGTQLPSPTKEDTKLNPVPESQFEKKDNNGKPHGNQIAPLPSTNRKQAADPVASSPKDKSPVSPRTKYQDNYKTSPLPKLQIEFKVSSNEDELYSRRETGGKKIKQSTRSAEPSALRDLSYESYNNPFRNLRNLGRKAWIAPSKGGVGGGGDGLSMILGSHSSKVRMADKPNYAIIGRFGPKYNVPLVQANWHASEPYMGGLGFGRPSSLQPNLSRNYGGGPAFGGVSYSPVNLNIQGPRLGGLSNYAMNP